MENPYSIRAIKTQAQLEELQAMPTTNPHEISRRQRVLAALAEAAESFEKSEIATLKRENAELRTQLEDVKAQSTALAEENATYAELMQEKTSTEFEVDGHTLKVVRQFDELREFDGVNNDSEVRDVGENI